MSLFSVKNYDVILTGGSRGIGEALLNAFIKEGSNVVMLDVTKPKSSVNYKYIKCDLSNKKSIYNAINNLNKLDIKPKVLVNCAAITLSEEAIKYKDSDWEKTISTNLTGTFYLCREIAKIMIKNKTHGSIINYTSISSEVGFENNPSYAASKSGVKHLTKALAVEWGKYNIRVNNVSPGYTNTPMNKKSWNDPKLNKIRSDNSVFNRWAQPEEMIGPTIFLASEASSYVTGIDLIVDGGWIIKGF